jgi:hypothetical protein
MEGLLVLLGMWAIFGTVIGLLAARKNRNAWAWGVIGGGFLLPAAIVLCFMSYLCPKCKSPMTNQEWKAKKCPRCGG